MPSLIDEERELVAIGAAIGAGCRPCTRYHVHAGLKSGLSPQAVRDAIDDAEAVRRAGGERVAHLGRRLLGFEEASPEEPHKLGSRAQALASIGAAAGCNAAGLLTTCIASAVERFELDGGALRSALEVAEAVKARAAEFLRRDAEQALEQTVGAGPVDGGSPQACCGPAGG